MNFTFGIITNADERVNPFIREIITSIRALKIPNYEIIIVGHSRLKGLGAEDISVIEFDESLKKGWITKKKNLITNAAKYENVVYQHDYVVYDVDWYKGFLDFEPFKACMNPIINLNGDRYRDWIMLPDQYATNMMKFAGLNFREMIIPYEENFTRWQYFSGTYWVSKKEISIEIPQDESKCWGEEEDVVWSRKFRNKYEFSLNVNSKVKLLKQCNPVWTPAPMSKVKKIKEYLDILNSKNKRY